MNECRFKSCCQNQAHHTLKSMEIYCEICEKNQPVVYDHGIDLNDKKYTDVMCKKCHLVLKTVDGHTQEL